MDDIVIIVKELAVRVVTGDPSEDPYGQGFSVIFAEAAVSESADVARLLDAKERRARVTFRCAMLDAVGTITKAEAEPEAHKFGLSVEGVTYRKPTNAWERVEPLRRRPA